MRTEIRSAADIDEVGWPDPAAVLQRIESTRSCWPSWRANSRSVVARVSVTVMSLPHHQEVAHSRAGGPQLCKRLVYRSLKKPSRAPRRDSAPLAPNVRNIGRPFAPLAPNVRNSRGRGLGGSGQALNLGDHVVQDFQARVPDTRDGVVQPDPLNETVRASLSAPGSQPGVGTPTVRTP